MHKEQLCVFKTTSETSEKVCAQLNMFQQLEVFSAYRFKAVVLMSIFKDLW